MAMKLLTGVDLNNQRGINFADPSSSTDAANKQYVDNNLAGLRWKAPVRVATTANGTLATAFENGDSVDGITLATNDRILLKDQTTQTENGIYIVQATGAPVRATDADSTAELNSATLFVMSGTVNAERAYTQTTDDPTVGSSNIVFVQFGAGTAYTADGNGIELSSTTFSLELDGTTLAKSSSGLRIGSGAAGAGLTETSGVLDVVGDASITVTANQIGLATGVAGSALTLTAGVLNVAAGTGLEISSDTIRIATTAAGTGLTGGGGSALSINTSIVAQKYSTTVGDAAATSYVITHGLNTRAVAYNIFETATPWSQVFADVAHTSTTTLTVTFATAPASGFYTIVVVG